MPTLRLRAAAALLLALLFSATAALAQTRHALIIAIGDYPDPQNRGWSPISSLKDVEFIQTALEGQQFKKENTNILRNAEASSAGITTALDALAAKAKAGDVVVIHVSSHGVQIQDDEADDEADLVDECIVTYGATTRMGKGGDNSKSRSAEVSKELAYYYRDDLFGEKIDAIRSALGPSGDVLVLMDCCHSATATRGWDAGKQRGGIKPITFADFPDLQARTVGARKADKSPDVFADAPAKGRGADGGLATYVCISGARAEEQNFEVEENGVGMGTLTYAVYKALSQLKEGTTYRGLFAQIEAIVQDKKGTRQHPVVEGSGLDRQIFGGVMTAQRPYVRIRTIKGKREIVLAEGAVSGLGAGAKVAVYPSGTADPSEATPLATGTVTGTTPHAATVALDADLSIGQIAQGWVFITEKAYAMEPIVIGFEGFTKEEKKTIQTALAGNTLLRFSGTPTMMLVNGATRDSLYQATGEVFFKSTPDAVRNPAALEAIVNQYAQYLLLRDLQVPFDEACVAVQLVPYSTATGVADTAGAARFRRADGTTAVALHDTVKVMVTNTSPNTVYVNILDLQPDGIIGAVLPNTPLGVAPEALKLAPGETKIFPGGRKQYIHIGEPTGAERFKVFSVVADNGDPLNLEAAATAGSRGNTGRGPGKLRAIESLVEGTVRSRGAATLTLPADAAVRVDDYPFLIFDPRTAGN